MRSVTGGQLLLGIDGLLCAAEIVGLKCMSKNLLSLSLAAARSRSRVGRYFPLESLPKQGRPIFLNGNIMITCTILKVVAASAAEAELGALFLNAQEAKVIRQILHKLGHPQPPTPIHVDNTTAVSIVSNTIKRQRSRAMEMRYFWLVCQEA